MDEARLLLPALSYFFIATNSWKWTTWNQVKPGEQVNCLYF